MSIQLSDIQDAQRRVAGLVRRTPQTSSATLSRDLHTTVELKLELFQKTGSFKVRGAFNKVMSVGPENCGHGLVAVSGGNHAQAVAYVARHLGLKAVIIMPASTPANYVEGTRGYGAEVVFAPNATEAFAGVAAYEARGWLPIHPFDDPLVIAGQGTVGLEIAADTPDLTDLVISIGGGGFMSGVATAVKSLLPHVRIWGVETVGADAMAQALAAGHPVQLPAITSIARTLGAPAVSPRTLAIAQRYLENVTVVTDAEAVADIGYLLERAKVLTEPAAACTLSAARRLHPNLAAKLSWYCAEATSPSPICAGSRSPGVPRMALDAKRASKIGVKTVSYKEPRMIPAQRRVAAASFLFLLSAQAASVSKPALPSQADFDKTVKPVLGASCVACHNDRMASGNLNISPFMTPVSVTDGREEWEKIVRKIRSGEMPPKGIPAPASTRCKRSSKYIEGEFEKADRTPSPIPAASPPAA